MLPQNTAVGAKAWHRKYGIVTVTAISGDAVTVELSDDSLLETWRKWLTLVEGD